MHNCFLTRRTKVKHKEMIIETKTSSPFNCWCYDIFINKIQVVITLDENAGYGSRPLTSLYIKTADHRFNVLVILGLLFWNPNVQGCVRSDKLQKTYYQFAWIMAKNQPLPLCIEGGIVGGGGQKAGPRRRDPEGGTQQAGFDWEGLVY